MDFKNYWLKVQGVTYGCSRDFSLAAIFHRRALMKSRSCLLLSPLLLCLHCPCLWPFGDSTQGHDAFRVSLWAFVLLGNHFLGMSGKEGRSHIRQGLVLALPLVFSPSFDGEPVGDLSFFFTAIFASTSCLNNVIAPYCSYHYFHSSFSGSFSKTFDLEVNEGFFFNLRI